MQRAFIFRGQAGVVQATRPSVHGLDALEGALHSRHSAGRALADAFSKLDGREIAKFRHVQDNSVCGISGTMI